MGEKIKIKFKNIVKVVYEDVTSGDLYIKYKGERLKCKWLREGYIMGFDEYGASIVVK